ncbi:MAG: B12-binding domain-containing radical SAM protein, partial [Nanoarchaeota archaeon]
MRLVFLWPFNEYYAPSVTFIQRAKLAEKAGHDVKIIFSNLLFSKNNLGLAQDIVNNPQYYFKKVFEEVEKQKPALLYIETFDHWVSHLPFALKFAREYKKKHKQIITIGGFVPTFMPERLLKLSSDIDYILRGNSERTVLNFVSALEKDNPEKAPAVSFKKEGRLIHNNEENTCINLDDIPFIDYENVLGNTPERIDIRTSKGCNMQCSFCSLHEFHKRPVRYNSKDYVKNQILHLKKLYAPKYIHIEDEMFLSKINRAIGISEVIRNNFPEIGWGAMIRNDLITEEILQTLSKNNFTNTAVGIESNNPKILKFLNKTYNTAQYIKKIEKNIELLAKYVKNVEIGLITGAPVENERDIIDMVDFVKQIKSKKYNNLKIALGKLMVYPGTNLWQRYENEEFSMKKDDNTTPFEKYFEKEYENIQWV